MVFEVFVFEDVLVFGVDDFVLLVYYFVVFEDVFVDFKVLLFDLGLGVFDGLGDYFGFDWYVVG